MGSIPRFAARLSSGGWKKLCSRLSRDSLHEFVDSATESRARFAWLTKCALALLFLCLVLWSPATGATNTGTPRLVLVTLTLVLVAIAVVVEFDTNTTDAHAPPESFARIDQAIRALMSWL